MTEPVFDFDTRLPRAEQHSVKWGRYGRRDVIAFGTADMDFTSPPCVTEALTARAQRGTFGYEYPSPAYHRAVTGWFLREYQWPVQPEWVLNCPGMWALFRLCLDAFTQPGDNVLIHAPHFHPAVSVIEGSGRRVVTQTLTIRDTTVHFDLTEFEQILARQRIALFFLINPHNPTGRLFPRDELIQIAALCDKYGVRVVSDEVHSYLTYDGAAFVPYGSVSPVAASHSVTLTSASKGFNLQGLTYALGIVPDPACRRALDIVRTGYDFDFAVNVFSLAATQAAYQDGKPWLTQLNTYLQRNLDLLDTYCRDALPFVRLIRPQGGYTAWLDFRAAGLNPAQLQQRILDDAGVGLTWGETFGPAGEGFERLNFACPAAVLQEGLANIRRVF